MITHRFDTIIGNIPGDWESAPMRRLLAFHKGGDWGDDEGEVETKVLRSTNFTMEGHLDLSDVAVRYLSPRTAEILEPKKGDLLLERSGGGPTQPVGRIAFIQEDMPGYALSNFVQLLRPNDEEINPEYLGWVLHELNRSGVVERLQHQTTQMRNLDYRDYIRVLVPKPPRPEQDAIANAFRLISEAMAKAKDEIDAAFRLKKALMQQLFTRGIPGRHTRFKQTKIGDVPEEWDVVPLKNIADIGSGITLNQDRLPQTNAVRYLTVINVQREYIDLSEDRQLELWESEIPDRLLQEGDILVVEGHANGMEIGRAAVVPPECIGMTFQNHLFRVRLNTDEVRSEYILNVLNSQRVQRHWNAVCNTSSGLNTINRRGLRNLLITKPKQDEQDEIISILSSVKASLASAEQNLTSLNRLKTSLLQNLLTGKVRLNVKATT